MKVENIYYSACHRRTYFTGKSYLWKQANTIHRVKVCESWRNPKI